MTCNTFRMRYLSRTAARRIYDRIGALQDSQAFYEEPALDVLVPEGDFDKATSVFEFGCGTGRLAARLLETVLPAEASYIACDISPKMVALAQRRISRFGTRVRAFETDGDPRTALGALRFDRIVTSYVLDLLPPEEMDAFLEAARKALMSDGKLCVASITPGKSFPASTVSRVWTALYRLSPLATGGCRPINLAERLAPDIWEVRHASTIVSYGVASSVVVATPRAAIAPSGRRSGQAEAV